MTDYPEGSGDERTVLEAFLDFCREGVIRKLENASDPELRKAMVPSGVSLLSLVKHLGYVERYWFQVVFNAEVGPAFADADYENGEDPTFRVSSEDTPESIIAWYRAMIARSKQIAAAASLEDLAQHPESDVTLRWILVHMIEETARHAGHADIIRELVDGVTGM